MENDQIVRSLEGLSGADHEKEEQAAGLQKKILIFTIDQEMFAVEAGQVKEIVTGNQLYYLPFVPPYVRGLINRHGEAYTVFDLKMIFENETSSGNKYLIMKIHNDQVCLIVSDVIGITGVRPEEILSLSNQQGMEDMFNGAFDFKEKRVLIVNMNVLLKRLENDLSK